MTLILQIAPPRCTAQHKGERVVWGRFVQHYEKAPQKRARLAYLRAIRAAAHGQVRDYRVKTPEGRLSPLVVEVVFRFQAPRRSDAGTPKVTRPDLDNMAKGLLDCLVQSGLMADDAQITRLVLTKKFSTRPCVVVRIADDNDDGDVV